MTKERTINWKNLLCCGIFIWFVINLLQGIFTEIQEDEAYYVLFGEHLAWGYFDHPPMVGLMTYLSSIFFSGTLGVRFFTIIASCLSLWVIWRIANLDCFASCLAMTVPRNDAKRQSGDEVPEPAVAEPGRSVEGPTCKYVFLFFILACSIVMFNIYGFVTTPDASLILFSALFLLIYQRYLAENSWKNALLMGVLMALMIYSKYHAFLLLGLIVLSNIKLLKDGKFWMACLLALALLAPHILWQIDNGFPSFKYHLSGRSEPFRWSYFWEYLPNQLLIFNPLTFGAVVYVLLKYRTENAFERGLKFILIGFFFFFWLMAFRGHVEPHWTIVCLIPTVVLVYRKALVDLRLQKFISHFVLPSVLLILVARITLMTPMAARFGFNDKEECYRAIETVAGDSPVVFRGSFQRPALYHYFTGKPSSTLCCYYDRMTQYDLWQFDKEWTGQRVLVCGADGNIAQTYEVDKVEFAAYLTEHFQTANCLETHFNLVDVTENKRPVFHRGDTIALDFSVYNPCNQAIDFNHPEFDMCLKLLLLSSNEALYGYYENIGVLQPHSTYEGRCCFVVGENITTGRNRLTLGISDRIATFATEGNAVEVFIED